MITLQPFVSLSLSRRAGIELIGEDSPRRCCFVIARRRQIYSDVSLLLSMDSKLLVCYFGGGCEKRHPSPAPPPPSLLHPHHLRFSSNVSFHPHGQMKANEAPLCFPLPNSFPVWIGFRVELSHDCQEQLGTQTKVVLH